MENTFAVWEGHMDTLMKKVTKIQNKCKKFGCDFQFEQMGEEIRTVKDAEGNDVSCKFILVHAEGTAKVNGWEFVASVEHTEKGNIFSKAMYNVEIPEKYRCSDPYCEHCHSNRMRKNTCIIRNSESGEFKQVGNTCLKDYTHGMDASFVVWLASVKGIFEEVESWSVGSCGWSERYYSTKEILQYCAETIRHFGYTKTDCIGDSTKDRMKEFFDVSTGNTRWYQQKEIDAIKEQMDKVGFNPESSESKKMVEDALAWLETQPASNDYMHNLKVATSLEWTQYGRFGLLVSLFPTFNRELEYQARKTQEKNAGLMSHFVGQIGDRLTIQVDKVKCITSWDSCFNGYTPTTTYVWKIVDVEGNVFTWKTATFLDEENPPASIKGTVKEHKVFRDVEQTELTRCKVA